MPVVHGLPVSVLGRQIPPGQPAEGPSEHAAEHLPMIGPAPRIPVAQQRSNRAHSASVRVVVTKHTRLAHAIDMIHETRSSTTRVRAVQERRRSHAAGPLSVTCERSAQQRGPAPSPGPDLLAFIEPHMWLYRQLGHWNWYGVGEDTFGRTWLSDGDAHHSLIGKPVALAQRSSRSARACRKCRPWPQSRNTGSTARLDPPDCFVGRVAHQASPSRNPNRDRRSEGARR